MVVWRNNEQPRPADPDQEPRGEPVIQMPPDLVNMIREEMNEPSAVKLAPEIEGAIAFMFFTTTVMHVYFIAWSLFLLLVLYLK